MVRATRAAGGPPQGPELTAIAWLARKVL